MFYNTFSNPWMIVIIAILIIDNLKYYLTTPGAFLALILSIPAILIAITFHEFAHAWMADKLGDDTPRRQGRLTLNPFAHIDPVGAVLLITAGFGWGKPVQINPNNFNRTISIKKGNALVSIAGPAMNIILAVIFSIIYGLLIRFGGSFLATTTGNVLIEIIVSTIEMNVGLGIFNLIPLPPLDGSKILEAFLPPKARIWYQEHQQILYIIFIIIWATPFASMLISPAIRGLEEALVKLIRIIAGV